MNSKVRISKTAIYWSITQFVMKIGSVEQ